MRTAKCAKSLLRSRSDVRVSRIKGGGHREKKKARVQVCLIQLIKVDPVRKVSQVSDESRSCVKEVQAASVLTSLNRQPIGNEVGEEVLPTVRWGQHSLLTLIDSKG